MRQNRFPFPDKESSLEIFENDPCYNKIPEEKRLAVFEDAWSVGVREAEQFIIERCRPAAFDMTAILEQMGFQLIRQDADYVMGNIRYFCEYLSQKNRINVYDKAVRMWANAHDMEFIVAMNIILAHEFFHYLEAHKLGWTSKRCLVPMLKIGKFSFGKTGTAALSEVAANAFANEYYEAYVKEAAFPDGEE